MFCFNAICHGRYSDFHKVYTDGSKRDEGVGAAAIFGRKSRTASLPIVATVFSAEMHAIHLAIEILKNVIHDKFVIFSDSYSSLQALSSVRNTDPIVR